VYRALRELPPNQALGRTALMDYSKTGLQLTERFEGCRLTTYSDVAGVLTIGYGHTGPDVVPGLTITQEQAEQLLQEDIANAVDAVNGLVSVQLEQNEFDALVDFVFNLGRKAFADSTLLQLLNAGDYVAAGEQFERWSHASGKVVAGLLARRKAEASAFPKREPEEEDA